MFERFFNNYYGSYKIISSAYERLLKTQFFEKKGNLPSEEKTMGPFFSFFQVWQTSKEGLLGSSRFFHRFCVGNYTNSLGPTRLLKSWKHNFLGKKSYFPVKESLWPTLSIFIEHKKSQWTFFEGPQGFLTLFLQLIKIYLCDLRGREQEFFHKLAVLMVTEAFG